MMGPSLIPVAGGSGSDPALEGRVSALEATTTLDVVVNVATFGDAGAQAGKGYLLFANGGDERLFGVAAENAAVGQTVTMQLTGVHNLGSSGDILSVGQIAYWSQNSPESGSLRYPFLGCYRVGIIVGIDPDDYGFLVRLDGAVARTFDPVLPPHAPVVERVVLYEELTSSGTWDKAAVLARPEFAGLSADVVEMEIIVVGGGAGGGVGSTAYGGPPGHVNIVKMPMAAFDATESYVVAAGGVSDTTGGISYFGSGEDVRAFGGRLPSQIEMSTKFGKEFSQARYPDMTMTGSVVAARPSSGDGPAGGGARGTGLLTDGGYGSGANQPLSTQAGVGNGVAGADALSGKAYALSFGAGGSSGTSTGGKGGRPGGGGGAGQSAGGVGGNGCIRILYRVREIA